MLKRLMLFTGLIFMSCSAEQDKICNKLNFIELHSEDKTINSKSSNEYIIRIFQFDVPLDLNNFKICQLDGVRFKVLGKFEDQYDPQRAYLKIPKKIDSLYLHIFSKGYVIPLSIEYNHYSLYLDKDGNVEKMDTHKDEFLAF